MTLQADFTWQKLLATAITDPLALLQILELDPKQVVIPSAMQEGFSLRVPHGFVARMKKGDYHDPLLRQVLPLQEEQAVFAGFTKDALNEAATNPLSGLLHKYQGRVLFIVTGGCAIHCRYCFRRYFPYEENGLGGKNWDPALSYIAKDTSIYEVILSGGDPLIVPDKYLKKLVTKIAEIDHVKILRIHSRLPIVLPERITDELLECLSQSRLRAVLVTHCNHSQEIDASVAGAAQRLRQSGVTLLNQAVLLKGINDSVVTLTALSERLFEIGILPYYVNLLDRVQGTAHFDVTVEHASQLLWGMMQGLPGYLVPRFVREQPGAPCKLPISP